MFLDDAISLCNSFAHVTEETPFGPEVLVYKVAGKVFALTNPNDVPSKMNLKCDPDRAIELRDTYEAVIPGYHMNKKHWNTVTLDQSVPDSLFAELIHHSYDLVFASLPKKVRDSL